MLPSISQRPVATPPRIIKGCSQPPLPSSNVIGWRKAGRRASFGAFVGCELFQPKADAALVYNYLCRKMLVHGI